MPNLNTSHQGTLRGSVILPVEPTSDGDAGFQTARSEMSSTNSEAGDPSKYDSHQEDDIEVEEVSDDDDDGEGEPQRTYTPRANLRKKTPKDGPAYVSPIPKIPSIPSVEPLRSAAHLHPTPPPDDPATAPKKVPMQQASKTHLVGKIIDEYGDIVDDDDNVLGRVEGDLPSMVGRTIANARGDVLGDDGELLGYVAEIGAGDGQNRTSKKGVPTWSLAEVMEAMAAAGKGPGGLRVDAAGTILDAEGNAVGSFRDNISGFGKKATEPAEDVPEDQPQPSKARPKRPKSRAGPRDAESEDHEGEASSTQEPRENAQSYRKEDPAISPSDIFLDVKSTTEGIQLTIRIPTVFNSAGEPRKPKIVFE